MALIFLHPGFDPVLLLHLAVLFKEHICFLVLWSDPPGYSSILQHVLTVLLRIEGLVVVVYLRYFSTNCFQCSLFYILMFKCRRSDMNKKVILPFQVPSHLFFSFFFLSRLSFAAKWHGLPPPLRLHHLPFQCKLDKHYLLTPFALRKAIKKLNCGKETRQLISSFRDEKYIFFLPPPTPQRVLQIYSFCKCYR